MWPLGGKRRSRARAAPWASVRSRCPAWPSAALERVERRMRRSLLMILLGATLALVCGGGAAGASFHAPAGTNFAWNGQGRCAGSGRLPMGLTGYKLTFDDEFDSSLAAGGPAVLPDGFNATWETKYFWGDRSLPQNGETQFYSDSSVGAN